jgi:hypothetical protein
MSSTIAQEVLAMVVRNHPIVKGERNGNLFKVAAELNNRGVEYADALQVCLQFEDHTGADPLTAREITQVVGSAYRSTPHASKTWVPSGKYRRPGPRLPSPWSLPEDVRAQLVAKLVADMEAQDAAKPPPATAPSAHIEAVLHPAPAAVATPDAHLLCNLARTLPHLHPYTLALELYVRTGVELSGQLVAKMVADTTKNSEGGNAPNAYPLSPSRQGRVGTPQR